MKDNKGFTLIEVVITIVIVSLTLVITTNLIRNTFSANDDVTYKIMKNNIVSAGYTYVEECTNGIIDCDFDYISNNKFSANVLKQYGYFENLNSPIDNRDLSECLILDAKSENGVILVNLDDQCY